MQSKLTTEQALEILGQALAHDSLKLTQKEHLILIEAFKTLQEALTDGSDTKGHLEKL